MPFQVDSRVTKGSMHRVAKNASPQPRRHERSISFPVSPASCDTKIDQPLPNIGRCYNPESSTRLIGPDMVIVGDYVFLGVLACQGAPCKYHTSSTPLTGRTAHYLFLSFPTSRTIEA
jgi:hypothetical protein